MSAHFSLEILRVVMLTLRCAVQSIVFSQFVNFLDLIQHRLTHAGVRCVKLDGSMSVQARDRVIDAFRDDPFITVRLKL
jgi:DNA repair protein RAD16